MNDTTGPIAQAREGHFPAGHVSPEAFEHAQRQAVAWELAQEEEAAAKAAREQAITERIAQRRGDHGEPGRVTTAGTASGPRAAAVDHDGEHEAVTD